MQQLQGRSAVVTGAASGIGLAVAEAFVAEGMRVVMSDVNAAALAEHAERLAGQGAEVVSMVADVCDQDAVERIAQLAVDRFGGLNVGVNVAGIVNRGLSWELTLDEWHRIVDVDLWGVIHGVRAFVPRILASGQEGHVVNVASMAAVRPMERLGPYSVAKHGVLALSDVLGEEMEVLGAPVGVSVVMPGMIRTGMNPIGTVPASAVAANVVDAMKRNRRYVYTDDHHIPAVEQRLRAMIAARADVV